MLADHVRSLRLHISAWSVKSLPLQYVDVPDRSKLTLFIRYRNKVVPSLEDFFACFGFLLLRICTPGSGDTAH